jgi:peptidyl-prolyl cis-trans isomerase C
MKNLMLKDTPSDSPELAYHLLRGAVERFSKGVSQLTEQQYEEVRALAKKTYALESSVLSTKEARDVVIPQIKLDQAETEISNRYESRDEFLADMSANGIDLLTLRNALQRELLFDAVMEVVSLNSLQVSDVDVRIFYEFHKDRFTVPEKRTARHILITVNPQFPENVREVALERITTIAEKAYAKPKRFPQLARKNSECPTAMKDGLLGDIHRGVLYPELDAVLFSMQEGSVSEVVETEIGFHVLMCEKIKPGKITPRVKAEKKIQQIMQDRARHACQKAWLDQLKGNHNVS